jgi:predicted nucleic-acid-binding protein
MFSVDTNVLVRLFVDDPTAEEQVKKVRERLATEQRVFVCQPVQIETAWVLQRCYDFGQPELLRVLDELTQNRAFELEHEALFRSAVTIFRGANMDFADAVVLAIGRSRGLATLTLDKKLAKQAGAIGIDA